MVSKQFVINEISSLLDTALKCPHAYRTADICRLISHVMQYVSQIDNRLHDLENHKEKIECINKFLNK